MEPLDPPLSTIANFDCNVEPCDSIGGRCNVTSGLCMCFIPNSGQRCDVTIAESLGDWFYAYEHGFAILFLLLTLFGVLQLIVLPKRSKTHTVLFLLLIFTTATRTIWLWLDPFDFRRMVPRVLTELLFGFAVWGLLAAYLTIITLWIETYIKTTTEYFAQHERLKRVRVAIWVIIVLLFFLNSAQDVIRALYGMGKTRILVLIVYNSFWSLLAVCSSIIYFIYGRRLYKKLTKFRNSNLGSEYIRKVTFLTTFSCVLCTLLVIVMVVVTVVYATKTEPQTAIPFFLGYHTIYRAMEFTFCLGILSIFQLRFRDLKDHISEAFSSFKQPLIHD